MPRLHLPLIEPGVRICRTRLSDGMREVGPQSGALRRPFAGPLVRSAGPDPVAEVLGNMATLRIVTASGTLPKSGPFPPPALPGLDGTMDLSDSPSGPACPSRASGWLTQPPPGVSRVACVLPVQTCHRHYPGGIVAGIGLLP